MSDVLPRVNVRPDKIDICISKLTSHSWNDVITLLVSSVPGNYTVTPKHGFYSAFHSSFMSVSCRESLQCPTNLRFSIQHLISPQKEPPPETDWHQIIVIQLLHTSVSGDTQHLFKWLKYQTFVTNNTHPLQSKIL